MSRSKQVKKWYIADLTIEIVVERDPRNVVHVNTVLISAADNEDAYVKALELGRRIVGKPYLNPAGKRVQSKFVGLRGLDLVHDPLTHGCELMYEEHVRVSRKRVSAYVTKKSDLNLFRRRSEDRKYDRPDYSSGKIARDYKEYVKRFESRKGV
jgi:hypothetical protein